MASRAHVVYDYSYRPTPRPRWSQRDDEPVVLPRGRSRGGYGALLVSGLIASAATVGAAYAVYSSAPEPMAATPSLPISSEWTPDSQYFQAQTLLALRGPALATPSIATLPLEPEETDTPTPSSFSSSATPAPRPERMPAPALPTPAVPAKPEAPPEPDVPYPNPTTTPPDLLPGSDLPIPVPRVDPENPY